MKRPFGRGTTLLRGRPLILPTGPLGRYPKYFPFQPHSSKEIPKHKLLVKHPGAHLPGVCGWDRRQEEHHGIAYHHQAVKGLLKLISLPYNIILDLIRSLILDLNGTYPFANKLIVTESSPIPFGHLHLPAIDF